MSCSYHGPTRKAFDWFTKFEIKENFCFGLVTTVKSDPITPIKFNDAWNHKDHEQRKLWRDAIQKELNSINKRNVWSIVPIREIPDGIKPIGNKWVLKIKRDGRYRARLVCLGYMQVPGIEFEDNFASVVNDMTFHTAVDVLYT